MTETLAEQDARRAALLSLLSPFPPEKVCKLPRVTCRDCSGRNRTCQEHKQARCEVCKGYLSTQHIHLDYVGHADVTEHLLQVDPYWQWEPYALDENGLPVLDTDDLGNPVGMWIKLTILGVTRPGYGSCPSTQSDAVKVLIGDAIRNAAMRFGVALDLWSKSERNNPIADNPIEDAGRRAMPARQRAADAQVAVDAEWVQVFEKRLAEADADHAPGFRQDVIDAVRAQRINSDTANRLLAAVRDRTEELSRLTATGLPANKDGSVSRSKLSDEEKTAAGLMTGAEVRAHNKLARDTVALDKEPERLPAVPIEGPWEAPPARSSRKRGGRR